MKKALCLFLLGFIITSCSTRAGYKKVVNSWVGSSEIDLIRSWGPPQQAYESGGTKFLVYNSSRNVHLAGTAPTYTTSFVGNTVYTNSYVGTPSQNINLNCQTTFEVTNGRIVSWSFRGNDCTAIEE